MRDKKKHSAHNLRYYHERRQRFIQKLRAKCSLCGSTDRLEIDHINSTQKSFNIGARMSYKESTILEELSKCRLLCHECHIKKTKDCKDGPQKINADTAIAICKEYINTPITQKDLAIKYGLAQTTISAILGGRRWADECAGVDRSAIHAQAQANAAVRDARAVERVDIDTGKVLEVYSSITSAAKRGNFNVGAISQCCNGNRKTHHGYIWRFATA